MKEAPLVSVVMSAYNSERYLRETLESISAQTFADYEFIVIDDGSTDGTGQILHEAARRDLRLQVITFQQNQGTVAGINRGLALARGKFIARMDSDDICRLDRFEKQVTFLETHPGIGLLGSSMTLIDPSGRELGRLSAPGDDSRIRWASLVSNPFAQPTIMIRRAVLVQHNLNYRPKHPAEDYDLWVRLLQYTRGANLPDPLVRYRVHDASASSRQAELKYTWHVQISYEHIQHELPGFVLSPEQHIILVYALNGFLKPGQRNKRPLASQLYLQLWRAFAARNAADPALPELRRESAMLAAKIGLYPPFLPGWPGLVRALFTVEPLWFVDFVIRLPEMVALKLRGFHLRRLRRMA
jgi:glycosyltransferase involved in cell wall biosynthesis